MNQFRSYPSGSKRTHLCYSTARVVIVLFLSKCSFISGRIARWAIELSEFSIQYKPRLALKGKVLVDFLVKLPQSDMDQDNSGWWILNVDGTSLHTGVGVGLQLKAPTRERVEQAIRLDFPTSNNETEYEAILVGIDLA